MTPDEEVAAIEKQLDKEIAMADAPRILRDFYNAPITVSALQPVLDLAVRLNPDLRVRS